MSLFVGQSAIVTGSSSGIGQVVAEQLAAQGARVAIVASAQLEKAQEVAGRIIARGGHAHPFVADISDFAQAQELTLSVAETFGGVNILINAAGVFYPTPTAATDPQAAQRMLDINILGPWNMITANVPLMRKNGGGRIVNIASVAGMIGVKGFPLYCASKAAVVMLTRALAAELAPEGIAVNAVAPGNTATPMNAAVRADISQCEDMRRITPSGVAFSDPADIAEIVLFLASKRAAAVHGATWLADEGISAAIGL